MLFNSEYKLPNDLVDDYGKGEPMSSKFEDWEEKYTFEKCAVGRKEHGEFLMSYLAGEREGFVLNLNGEWGSGKTEFLRRMYTGLKKRSHPVIYIDAWESDFCGDPLLVVASELLEQMRSYFDIDGTDLDKLKEFIGSFLKGSLVAGAGLATKHLLDDSSAGSDFVKEFIHKDSGVYLNQIKTGYTEQISAIQKVRDELENLSQDLADNGKQLPVVVLIDELDRCRPSYSIEMLEVIKHFFTTKNFVFVVATDTIQLQHSIKAVYGSRFASDLYLKRFFNREAKLAQPNVNSFIKKHQFEEFENISLYPIEFNMYPGQQDCIRIFLEWISIAYSLSLRDIEQLVAKLKACLREIKRKGAQATQVVNIFSLIVALVEYDVNKSNFEMRDVSKPYEIWEREDFYIDDTTRPTKFSEFYKINMVSSVKHLVHLFGPRDNKVEMYWMDSGEYKVAEDSSNFIRGTEQRISSALKCQDKSQSKIWLWGDYVKLVTLADTLK